MGSPMLVDPPNQYDQIGRFIALWATFQSLCNNYFTLIAHIFREIFKRVKIFHFSSQIIFGQLSYTSCDFLLVTLLLFANKRPPSFSLSTVIGCIWIHFFKLMGFPFLTILSCLAIQKLKPSCRLQQLSQRALQIIGNFSIFTATDCDSCWSQQIHS